MDVIYVNQVEPLEFLQDLLYNKNSMKYVSPFSSFLPQGQCCCAGSRLMVQEGIYDEFVAKATERAAKRTVGEPFSGAEQGPQVGFQKKLR